MKNIFIHYQRSSQKDPRIKHLIFSMCLWNSPPDLHAVRILLPPESRISVHPSGLSLLQLGHHYRSWTGMYVCECVSLSIYLSMYSYWSATSLHGLVRLSSTSVIFACLCAVCYHSGICLPL